MNQPTRFLLDGHNMLYALRGAFAQHLADGHPGTAAREALVDRLARACDRLGLEAWLYFDGDVPHEEMRGTRLRVVYPGGGGEQQADQAILRRLSAVAAADTRQSVVVVTRDVRLARRSRKLGAEVMDPSALFSTWELGGD